MQSPEDTVTFTNEVLDNDERSEDHGHGLHDGMYILHIVYC